MNTIGCIGHFINCILFLGINSHAGLIDKGKKRFVIFGYLMSYGFPKELNQFTQPLNTFGTATLSLAVDITTHF